MLAGETNMRPRKCRILHSVGHLLRGGIENWLFEVVRHLDPARYEHTVLVWTDEDEACSQEFRSAGVAVLPCLNHRNPVLFARNLQKLLEEHGPYDLLHTHGTHYHGYVMLLGLIFGIRVRMAHSHTDIGPVLRRSGLLYRTYAAIGHRALRGLATRGLGVSEFAAVSMFGANWRDDPRWGLLYCGIDLEPFDHQANPSLRTNLGIPEGRFVVGHVGRFEEQKNHAFLLELAVELFRKRSDTQFLLIGDGPLRPAFVDEVATRGLASRFTFVPDCRAVPDYMISAMDGFVFPSIYEGLPLVTIEAQAAGLPCLISDCITREAVVNTPFVRQLSLDLGSAAWAEAVCNMPERINNQDHHLREMFVQSPFNIERCVNDLARIYEHALPVRRNGGPPSTNRSRAWIGGSLPKTR